MQACTVGHRTIVIRDSQYRKIDKHRLRKYINIVYRGGFAFINDPRRSAFRWNEDGRATAHTTQGKGLLT